MNYVLNCAYLLFKITSLELKKTDNSATSFYICISFHKWYLYCLAFHIFASTSPKTGPVQTNNWCHLDGEKRMGAYLYKQLCKELRRPIPTFPVLVKKNSEFPNSDLRELVSRNSVDLWRNCGWINIKSTHAERLIGNQMSLGGCQSIVGDSIAYFLYMEEDAELVCGRCQGGRGEVRECNCPSLDFQISLSNIYFSSFSNC